MAQNKISTAVAMLINSEVNYFVLKKKIDAQLIPIIA